LGLAAHVANVIQGGVIDIGIYLDIHQQLALMKPFSKEDVKGVMFSIQCYNIPPR